MRCVAAPLVVAACLVAGGAWAQQPKGDRGPSSQSYRGIAVRLASDLDIEFSGDPDADYTGMMIALHQGVIDTAKAEIAFGKDPDMKRSAEGTIKTEEAAIQSLRAWQSKKPK